MKLPALRRVEDLMRWAGDLVVELERQDNIDRAQQRKARTIQLFPYQPVDLPAPRLPGLICNVDDATDGIIMLVSSDSGEWRRVDDQSVYPPP